MPNVITWSDFLLLFSAEAWFFGQLPPLCAETAHYGVWETTLRELEVNEKLITCLNLDDTFCFSRKDKPGDAMQFVDSVGKIFVCINLNGNTKDDPFTECWTTTGILHASLDAATKEMTEAENYIKSGGKESIPVVPSSTPPGSGVN